MKFQANYSIKDLEKLSGIKAHTLRIWEQRYDFLKPKRTDTKIRYYTDEQLRLLLNIGTLNRNGMKISKIAELNEQEFSGGFFVLLFRMLYYLFHGYQNNGRKYKLLILLSKEIIKMAEENQGT